jgi:hypothetical protein
MKFIFYIIFVLFYNSVVHALNQAEYRTNFQAFVQSYTKNYETAVQKAARFAIWKKNYDFVEKHNIEADAGMHSYRVKMNEYGDLVSNDHHCFFF